LFDLLPLANPTDHCGAAISASATMRSGGRAVARKGDAVSCLRHDGRPNLIINGHESMTNDGVPSARHGFRALRVRMLISILT